VDYIDFSHSINPLFEISSIGFSQAYFGSGPFGPRVFIGSISVDYKGAEEGIKTMKVIIDPYTTKYIDLPVYNGSGSAGTVRALSVSGITVPPNITVILKVYLVDNKDRESMN
jgi:hypothetical protein